MKVLPNSGEIVSSATAHWPKILFFALIVRPLVLFVLGINQHHRERLPKSGPCILACNHNSHLDTIVLMSLFPLKTLRFIRPVAAADYFLKNRVLAWFALRIIGIIPIPRGARVGREEMLGESDTALEQNQILIVFPEGSRGEPEKLSALKKGVYRLAAAHPECVVVPVFTYGLGKALPKGEALFVPFNCEIAIDEPLAVRGDAKTFLAELDGRFERMAHECHVRGNEGD